MLIKKWFDLANVYPTNDKSTPFKSLYGTFLYEQDKLLNEMYSTIILTVKTMKKKTMETMKKKTVKTVKEGKQMRPAKMNI